MFASLSQSMINSFMICPERFRRRYVEEEIIPPGIAAKIGTGFHKGCEVNHLAKLQSGMDEPLDVIQDAARDEYVRSVKEDGVLFAPEEESSARVKLEEGIDTVVELAESYYCSLAPQIHPALVEETLYVDIPELDLPLQGRIDVYTTDGWLPDLKTAARKWSQVKADTSVQATVYHTLVLAKTGEPPKKLSFEVFVKNKKSEHQSVETTRSCEDFRSLCVRIQTMMRLVYAGLFSPAPADSWICQPKWCGYFWTCPYIPAHRKCHN